MDTLNDNYDTNNANGLNFSELINFDISKIETNKKLIDSDLKYKERNADSPMFDYQNIEEMENIILKPLLLKADNTNELAIKAKNDLNPDDNVSDFFNFR